MSKDYFPFHWIKFKNEVLGFYRNFRLVLIFGGEASDFEAGKKINKIII